MLPETILDSDELRRYSRHLSLPGVGLEGQERLARSRVLLIGAGGLGSPAALYLAAAGVGHLGIVDDDVVDESNLQRQVLHGTADVGRRKTDSARDRLTDLNPLVHVETYDTRLTAANALEIIRDHDVVVDGTDNFQTRYLSNDACVLLGKPNVYGSVLRWEGQASVFATPDGPCYRCLFREPPPPGLVPTCVEAGVLGVLPGLVGMVQATETLKLLLGHGDTLAGRLLLLDAARMRFRTIELRRDPSCPACGTRELRTLIDYEAFCGVHATLESATSDSGNGAGDPARDGDVPADITPAELADRLRRGETLEVIDVREPYEHAIARLPGARLVPLATVASAAGSLDPEREIVVHCHHGMRSARAAAILREAGFRRVRNLVGGIDRWSTDVDASVPRY
ncbi:MAG TPA: molybdopterin-synthase adenylyltransferase MoeB [Gemmatimonadaceae bacterium]|nr:molybdopterin-synthase adenylyltransferase MoeB [Gemmatimonadaceae bacterium]